MFKEKRQIGFSGDFNVLGSLKKVVESGGELAKILGSSSFETKELFKQMGPIVNFVLDFLGIDSLDKISDDPEKEEQAKKAISFLSNPAENVGEHQTEPEKHENYEKKIMGKDCLVIVPDGIKEEYKGKPIPVVIHMHGAKPGSKDHYFSVMDTLFSKDKLPGVTICPHNAFDLKGKNMISFVKEVRAYVKADPRFDSDVKINFTGHSYAGTVFGGKNLASEEFREFMKEDGSGFFALDPVVNKNFIANIKAVVENNKNSDTNIPLGMLWGYVKSTEGTEKNMMSFLNSDFLPMDGAEITRDGDGKIIGYSNPDLDIHIEKLQSEETEFKNHKLAVAGMNYLVRKTLA